MFPVHPQCPEQPLVLGRYLVVRAMVSSAVAVSANMSGAGRSVTNLTLTPFRGVLSS